ncbi:hypothetical protein ACFL03_15470 [Thermodesulfobacteriota bacterium]
MKKKFNWAGSILKPGVFIMLDQYLKSFSRLPTYKTAENGPLRPPPIYLEYSVDRKEISR